MLLLDALQGTKEKPDRDVLIKNTKQFSGNRIKAGVASSHCSIAHAISSVVIDCYGPGLQRANYICAYTSDSELLLLSIRGEQFSSWCKICAVILRAFLGFTS